MTSSPKPTTTRRCRLSHRCGVCGEMVATGTMEGLVTEQGWCHMAGCIVTVPPLPRADTAGDDPRPDGTQGQPPSAA
jgi:hypothetical protein